jgi:hypothetical protein
MQIGLELLLDGRQHPGVAMTHVVDADAPAKSMFPPVLRSLRLHGPPG